MIYLTGESHIGCLMRAAAEREPLETIVMGAMGPGGKLSHNIFLPRKDRVAFGVPAVRQQIQKLTGQPAIMQGKDHLFGFSLGFHAFRVCQSRTWRTFYPAALKQEEGKQPLSSAMIDTMIREDSKHQRGFYKALKALDIPCFVIESPPLQRNLPIMTQGFASGGVIQHLFERYRTLSMAFFEELGIDVVTFPPEARSDDGFLKTELETEREGDVRHANGAYGALMLDRVLDYLRANHADRL